LVLYPLIPAGLNAAAFNGTEVLLNWKLSGLVGA